MKSGYLVPFSPILARQLAYPYTYSHYNRKSSLAVRCVVSLNFTGCYSHCVTLTFAERNHLALSLSGNKPLSAN